MSSAGLATWLETAIAEALEEKTNRKVRSSSSGGL